MKKRGVPDIQSSDKLCCLLYISWHHQPCCPVSCYPVHHRACCPALRCGPAAALLSLSFQLLDLCEKQKFVIQIAFYILCRTCILTQNIGFSPFFRPLRTFLGITPGNFDTYSLICPSAADFSALIRASRLRIISRSLSVMTDAVTSDLSVGLSPAESRTSWKQ